MEGDDGRLLARGGQSGERALPNLDAGSPLRIADDPIHWCGVIPSQANEEPEEAEQQATHAVQKYWARAAHAYLLAQTLASAPEGHPERQ